MRRPGNAEDEEPQDRAGGGLGRRGASAAWRPGLTAWDVAHRALADAAQVIPRVDAGFVAVVPLELQRVLADRSDVHRSRRRFVHHQQRLRLWLRLAGRAAALLALIVACGARAGVAQPAEVPRTLVAIAPVDFDAGAFSLLDADFQGSDGVRRETVIFVPGIALGLFFADDANSFVAHDFLLLHCPAVIAQLQDENADREHERYNIGCDDGPRAVVQAVEQP